MAKTKKRAIGDVGEEVACRYLEGRGYTIVDRNYLRPWGEIDIVAKLGDRWSFVEVKTVSREPGQGGGVRPEENLHAGKLHRLNRAVQTYLLQKKIPESAEWQIDLVCVYLNFETRRAKIELFERISL